MRRAALGLLALALSFGSGPSAAEVTFKLPPPEIVGLLPLAALPLDKPPVPVPPVAAPPAPALPDPPSPRLVSDIANRPVAPMPPPRMLACNPMGTVFKVASELLECGRARYQKGELEAARSAFQSAVDESGERPLLREARYWLGETLLRLGRPADAQAALSVVALDDPRGELAYFANHELGYIALEQNDPTRALGYFEGLLKGRMPIVLIPSSRHGRALALYGLKRYAEARDEWSALLAAANVPRALVTEATFWMGETLGRLGDYKGAVSRLQTFTGSSPRILADSGLLSLGWWSRADGRADEAIKAYRTLLSSSPETAAPALWARAGLVQALLDKDDYAKAREEFKQLEALDKQGTLSGPTLLLLRRWAADKSKVDEARELDTDLLGRQLAPAARAWVLLLSADLARRTGNADEARDRLELIAATPAAPAVKQQADLRRAQLSFDARDFAQAQSLARGLLDQPLAEDVRAAAMVVAAESAYWARDYDTAATLYGRFLSEFAARPEAPQTGVALGWAEFRRGRLDAARQRWTAFAREAPGDPRAADALLLAAELADKAGDVTEARSLLDRVVSQHPQTEQADVARLNRAILSLRAGRPQEALTELGRLGSRTSSAPELTRARVARGIALIETKGDAQAEANLRGALGHGDDALCHLGLGVIAFRRGQWDAAGREFAEARDVGGSGTASAEYGLAAVAFNQGKADEFKKMAGPLLAGPPGAATPSLLRGMEALAIGEKRWGEARTLAMRLADQFPRHTETPPALADLGAAAASDAQWPLAREMYQLLAARYPSSPGRQAGRAALGEALLRTGAPAEARRELEGLIASLPPGDATRARVMPILAEAQEATGDRAAAAQSYARAAAESPSSKGAPTAELGAGRLLQSEGKWSEAQPLLERALKAGEPGVAAEAAYHMGEGLRAAGQHDDAIEAYMTAAYVAPDSSWGRRALLGAGRSYAALKQNEAAAIVYRKLLAASSAEPELQSAARQGLSALGLN